jgi:hypothetical protein
MDQTRAQQLIVGSLAASAAVAAGSSLAEGDAPGLRLVVGVAFTGVGLATVAMFSPDLAGAFSVLILTSTVFLYGRPFMDAVTNLTDPDTKRTGTRRRSNPTRKVVPA